MKKAKNKKAIPEKALMNARLTLRIELDLHAKIQRKALEHNVNASTIARHALESYFAEE